MKLETKNLSPFAQKVLNSYGRKKGVGKIDFVVMGDKLKLDHTPYGYRKNTTGEYVSKSYANKCCGRGVYYQNAISTLIVTQEFLEQNMIDLIFLREKYNKI